MFEIETVLRCCDEDCCCGMSGDCGCGCDVGDYGNDHVSAIDACLMIVSNRIREGLRLLRSVLKMRRPVELCWICIRKLYSMEGREGIRFCPCYTAGIKWFISRGSSLT